MVIYGLPSVVPSYMTIVEKLPTYGIHYYEVKVLQISHCLAFS